MSGKMAIRMVLDDLTELFRVRKAFSVAEYKEAMKAHHRAENSMFLLREQGRSQGVLSHEHYQALRMVMGDIKELLIAKELTVEQYRAQLAAAHDRSLADEASDLIAAGGAASGLHWSAVGDMCEGQGKSSNSSLSANGMSTIIAAGGAASGLHWSTVGDMCEGQGKSSDSNAKIVAFKVNIS